MGAGWVGVGGYGVGYAPQSDVVDGLLCGLIVACLHHAMHRRQLHLPLEVHRHSALLHRRVLEVLLRVAQLSHQRLETHCSVNTKSYS